MNVSRDVGRQLAQRREELGWSQEHLAKMSGVSTSTIRNIENGGRVQAGAWIDQVVTRHVRQVLSTLGYDAGAFDSSGELVLDEHRPERRGTALDGLIPAPGRRLLPDQRVLGVEEAIEADPRLDPWDKKALKMLYQEFVERNALRGT